MILKHKSFIMNIGRIESCTKYYNGRVLTNVLISFFTLNKYLQCFIILGALFHSLDASFIKADWLIRVWPFKTKSLLVIALVVQLPLV